MRCGHWARIALGTRGCVRQELLRVGIARPDPEQSRADCGSRRRFDGSPRTSTSFRMRVDTILDFAASNAGAMRARYDNCKNK